MVWFFFEILLEAHGHIRKMSVNPLFSQRFQGCLYCLIFDFQGSCSAHSRDFHNIADLFRTVNKNFLLFLFFRSRMIVRWTGTIKKSCRRTRGTMKPAHSTTVGDSPRPGKSIPQYRNNLWLTREKRTACREDSFRVFLRRTSVLPFYRYFVPQRFSYPLSYFISWAFVSKRSVSLFPIPPRLLPPESLLTHRILSIPLSSLFCGLSRFSFPCHRSRALIAS